MKSKIAVIGGVFGALVMAGSAAADAKSYQAAVERCLNQYANANDAATVTLECTAAGGKLGDCKVVDNTGP